MDYIFDEVKYARKIFLDSKMEEPTQEEINYVALYLKYQHSDLRKVREKLENYLNKKVGVNRKNKKWQDKMSMAIRYARKNELTDNSPITFTDEEIEFILDVEREEDMRVLFVLCCFVKHYKRKRNNLSLVSTKMNIFPKNTTLIGKYSKIKTYRVLDILKRLKRLKYIEIGKNEIITVPWILDEKEGHEIICDKKMVDFIIDARLILERKGI